MHFKSVSVRAHANKSDLAPTTVGCLFNIYVIICLKDT